jgi:hypothetical protein
MQKSIKMIINVDWNKNGAWTSHYTIRKPGPNSKYALPPKLGQVERSSSKSLTHGCWMDHFHLNVCIGGLLVDFILNF